MNKQEKILAQEKTILAEEKEILNEIKKEEKMLLGVKREIFVILILATLLIVGTIGGLIFWRANQGRIYIEDSSITAPHIDLSTTGGGILEEVMVNSGDQVEANAVVARVGTELIKTGTAGKIINVNNNVGKLFNRGEVIVSMIEIKDLRVVGSVSEDKGLSDIVVGQRAMFTVDAFDSKQYFGTVDEISPTAKSGDVVFNISDKREEQEFNVKARFNVNEYSELKDGMSAKLWIYKN
ncbi:MAG: HlyD family secretion protein [Patescibacteria group bacterium]|nr:HlyD family secretion protein [Patescibacteria group bacterium]MDD4610644.1 HlyD family secretion protein [Patescibacteria group bacterium]